jgi:hypothetical protein
VITETPVNSLLRYAKFTIPMTASGHDPKCSSLADRVRFAPDSGRIAASQRTAAVGHLRTYCAAANQTFIR